MSTDLPTTSLTPMPPLTLTTPLPPTPSLTSTLPAGGGTPLPTGPAATGENPPVRIDLLGMTVDALDLEGAAREVLRWCRAPRGMRCRFVVTPNVDHAVMFQSMSALQHAYERASLVLADGAPIVWASRWLGKPLPGRAAGSDLAPALFEQAAVSCQRDGLAPLRVFLLGAAPGVAERAARRIEAQWRGVEVVGTFSPPLGFQEHPTENQQILAKVAESAPDLLVVGLGAPKQELWIDAHADRLEAKAALCIGATIDFLAGEKSRAPRWMQRSGLEWLHRLASEPRRLAGRYLRDAWIFPQLVCRDWVAGGRQGP